MAAKQQAILEIEESALSLTVAEAERGSHRITHSVRLARTDQEPETLTENLADLLRSCDTEVRQVHVLLGDRRFLHFRVELPRMRPDELRTFFHRECLRVGSLAGDVRVIGQCRHLRQLSSKQHRYAVVALPNRVWTVLAPAFERNNLEVLSLTSIEEAMRNVLPADFPDIAAVLDVSGNRARFVQTEHGAVTQVRRFLLPTVSSDPDQHDPMLAAHLAIEIPRTLDYLAEIEHPMPRALLIGQRAPIAESELAALATDIPRCERLAVPVAVPPGQSTPSLATIGRLESLRRGQVASVLGDLHIKSPRSKAPFYAGALAASIGAVAIWQGLQLRDINKTLLTQAASATNERRNLEREESSLLGDREPLSPLIDEELDRVMRRRRPASLLLSEVCNAVPPGMHLTEISFDNEERISIRGHTTDNARLTSLRRVAEFTERLNTLACLAGGTERILETDGTGQLEFITQFTWRQP